MPLSFLFLPIFLNVGTESAVPAIYIFGDSTFDVGTNNFLKDSNATANMPFYGIDFPNSTPTGRFSNGYNTADRIVQLLGYNESPPPFLYLVHKDTESFKNEILRGVNFASGGSGILDNTGKQPYSNVVSVGNQIKQFSTVVSNISEYADDSAEARINKSLFLLRQNLMELGARKFGILSVPPIGCVPILSGIANATTHCFDEVNVAAQLFNMALDAMLLNLSSQCPNVKYSLGHSFNIVYSIINDAAPLDLDNVTSACCGNETLSINGLLSVSVIGVPCSPIASVCRNRDKFFFWDQYHPTQGNNYALVFFFFPFSVALGVKDAPTLFIFGDSIFDVGTNNFLRSKAKANFPYNGIDFYNSIPTGRFSNGFNTADQIARQFGYKQSPPPFLTMEKNQYSFKKNILQGVNFASAGSGILRETGALQWGEVVFFGKQVQQFASVRGNISEILGAAEAATFVSKALFLISAGSNDLFDFTRNHSASIHLGQKEYLGLLQLTYYSHIKKLYELGGRKFGILGVAPVGCCPAVTSANGGTCVKPLNDLAVAFYSATRDLLTKLSYELQHFEYSLANSFVMTTTLLKSANAFGLKETRAACCGSGYLNGQGGCIKAQKANLCRDRKDHLFWDWFHPTEIAAGLAAKTFFGGPSHFVFPLNLCQLASSNSSLIIG
ncbi:hypothetical protein RJT34_30595 [Clitoria ternatea]|uniref:Uncharacterized protein n=1 Tax=Clitoria ternatea TaxID=43366 RepID=A0AAN9EUW4_CLITE